MTLSEAIAHCEEVAEENEQIATYDLLCTEQQKNDCLVCASEHRQLAGWLRELQRYRFEISECKAVLDNPTPDVTENDRKRAMYVLQTFPDVRGGKS